VEAGAAELAADPQGAQRLADALERLDPLNEPALRLGLTADREAGDLAALHRRYRRFVARLKTELAAAPASETQALFEALSAAAPPRAPDAPPEAVANLPPPRVRRGVLLALAIVAVLAMIAAVVAWTRTSAPPASPSLAVLPFSGQAAYYGPGVSDAVLDLLARDPRLKVVGSTSARVLGAGSPVAAARRLGVGYVLTGTAGVGGGRTAIDARLVRARDGHVLWSRRYNRPSEDVFAVQTEIASAVAEKLGTRIAAPANPHLSTRPEVYDRYLQARSLARTRQATALMEARRLLLEAAALDPNYAPAFASLAQVTMLLANHPTSYGDIPLLQAQADSRRYARRALELAPELGEAYAAYGLISLSDGESLPFYQRAVALDPQRADFHRWLGQSYEVLGRHQDALSELRRAVALEPLWGLCSDHLIGHLTYLGRYDEARAVADRFARLSPDPVAVAQVRRSLAIGEGRFAEYLKLTQLIQRRSPPGRSPALEVAKGWALLGDSARAVRAVPRDETVARLALSGDVPGLAAEVRRLGVSYWQMEPNAWDSLGQLVTGGQGALVLQLYDAEFRSVADFYDRDPSRAIYVGPALIPALQGAGRGAEADELAARLLRRLDQDAKAGAAIESLAWTRAAVLAETGRHDAALDELDRGLRANWSTLVGVPAKPFAEQAPFRSLAGDPRLGRLQAALDARLNGERALAGLPPLPK
jgi:TolB-like protein